MVIRPRKLVSPRLRRNIQSVEGEVTKYGTGAHIVLPKDWIGSVVRVVRIQVNEDEKKK